MFLYLESFGNPRKFARVAARVARSKPILAMRSGTSRAGARAASSHTAALAGSDAAVDALFWQAGVLRARTLEELLDAAVFFSTQPLPRGNRVAVLTNAGGLGILCADACDGAGLVLPELSRGDTRGVAQAYPGGGERREPRRPARLRDCRDVRGRVAGDLRRSGHRRGNRTLRPAGRRDGGRRVRGAYACVSGLGEAGLCRS